MALRYRPEIDGLRACAVVPVVLYHAGLGFPGGFVGVDVFFVISGFLITRILADEMRAGRFSIVAFYERRARRILPALFAMILVCGAVGLLVLPPKALQLFAASALATILFCSNLWFWGRGQDYFAADVIDQPLLHTWSLGVEEQFYILFPPILFLLMKRPARQVTAWVLAATVASFILSVVWVTHNATTTFYMLPTRAWELGVGSLLALGFVPAVTSRAAREIVGALGIAALALPVLLYDDATLFPGLAALPPVLGAAALLLLTQSEGETAATRMLSLRPMVSIGLLSYALYLWHWPIIVLTRIVTARNPLPVEAALAVLLISGLSAYLSWRYVEMPFRSRERFTQGQIFRLSGGLAAAIGLFAAAIFAMQGLPRRFSPRTQLALAAADETFRCRPVPGQRGACQLGDPRRAASFVLWGDSHALGMAPAFDRAARRSGRSGYLLHSVSCPPLEGIRRPRWPKCERANRRALRDIAATASIRSVFMAARWPVWHTGTRPAGETGTPVEIEDLRAASGSPAAIFTRAYDRTLERLAGREVTVIADVPEIGWNVPRAMFAHAEFGAALPTDPSQATVRARQGPTDLVLARVGQRHGARIVDPTALFCAERCATSADGRPIYSDDNHLSPFGAERLLTRAAARLLLDD